MKRRYNKRYNPKKVLGRRILFATFALIAASITVLYYFSTNTTSRIIKASPELLKVSPDKYKPKLTQALPWPAYGQSAYGTMRYGVLAKSSSQDRAVPIASLAKTITALAVLEKKPLKPGDLGPNITLSQADVNLYNKYLQKNGSVAKVTVGQKLKQYHAMQAMLMQSANNISDSLVIWAFGSMDNYTKYANNMVKKMNLSKTHVADASGFSPRTVSTAEEMTQVAIAYMKLPVLREITMKTDAKIPTTGTVINYNARLNTKEIIGIKAGDTDEALRCFMSASIKNGEIYSVSVVLGAKTFTTAIQDTHLLLKRGDLAAATEL